MADANSEHLSLTILIYEIKTHSRFSELLEEWTIKNSLEIILIQKIWLIIIKAFNRNDS